MENNKQLPATGIDDATSKAKNLLHSIVQNLELPVKPELDAEEPGEVTGNGQPALFFPGGIDLINVTVKIAGVDVEVTISGPGGNGALQPAALPTSGVDKDATVADGNAYGFAGYNVKWNVNDDHQDKSVNFKYNEGSPFDTSAGLKFEVHDGTVLMAHVSCKACGYYSYDHDYLNKDAHGGTVTTGGGTSKILIRP
ncbi:MAG: hypothetical protein ABSF46_12150 [Terriglobia bacterium]|jgi:hypothetical protein